MDTACPAGRPIEARVAGPAWLAVVAVRPGLGLVVAVGDWLTLLPDGDWVGLPGLDGVSLTLPVADADSDAVGVASAWLANRRTSDASGVVTPVSSSSVRLSLTITSCKVASPPAA